MYCPECGNDAGSAKFCPECGANLSGVKDALAGRKAAAETAAADAAPAATTTEAEPAGGPRRLSPAVIWGGFGALAVVVIIVVVMMSGGFGSGNNNNGTGSAGASAPPVQAITADTSGSYETLVSRAKDLSSQGNTAFGKGQADQASQYFAAAAKVYAAAWAKKSTDPAVGSDYAFALFSGGDIPAALKQVDAVLKASPDYQRAWFYKGFLISHEGQLAKQDGSTKDANQYFDQAKQALTKAVALDPKSDVGKQADSFLQSLQQQ